MRIRKLRGGRRKCRQIEAWVDTFAEMDDEHLLEYGRQYVKIYLHPWGSLQGIHRNSCYKEPKGQARILIIKGLVTIYTNWKKQLETLGKPYYLKIWLAEPRISKSQVVAAISSEKIDWYEEVFTKANEKRLPQALNFTLLTDTLEKFNWDLHLDEEQYEEDDLGEPQQYESLKDYYYSVRWFNKIKRRARVVESQYSNGESFNYYFVKKGNMWVGELKPTNP